MSRLLVAVCLALLGVVYADTMFNLNGRSYSLVTTQVSGSNLPLVLFFNGINSGCGSGSDLLKEANNLGLNIVAGAVCAVNSVWDLNGQSDLDFTDAVINDIASKFSIDRSKIFLSGWSMGGMFVSTYACQRGTKILAISPSSCALQCTNGNSPAVHWQGMQGIYDSVCPQWVDKAYSTLTNAFNCPIKNDVNSNSDVIQTCRGKRMELRHFAAPHMYLHPDLQMQMLKDLIGGPTPPPASGACGQVGENQNLALSCPSGQVLNAINFASYGTPSGSCSSGFSTSSCNSATSLSVVQDACVAKSSCSVSASNTAFGDPCSGTGKNLAVQATCATPLSTPNTCNIADEGSSLTMGCAAGQKITKVNFASYGTPQGSCQNSSTGTCHATTSVSAVEKLCLSTNQCTVAASNSVFGDPCSGTAKKLAIIVTCA